MKTVKERLVDGINIYLSNFEECNDKERNNYPNINYPERIKKYFFDNVHVKGKNIHVVFLEVTYYQIIVGYTQINYHRYKDLSEVLEKTRYVEIKTPLDEYYYLLNADDEDVKKSAYAIAFTMYKNKITTKLPLWASSKAIEVNNQYIFETTKNEYKSSLLKYKSKIRDIKNDITIVEHEICNCGIIDFKLKGKFTKNLHKIAKLGFLRNKVLIAILSFGLYNPYLLYKIMIKRTNKLFGYIIYNFEKREKRILEYAEDVKSLENANYELNVFDNEFEKDKEQENVCYKFDQETIKNGTDINSCCFEIIKAKKVSIIEFKHKYESFKYNYEKYPSIPFSVINETSLNKYLGLDLCTCYILKNILEKTYYVGFSFHTGDLVYKLLKNNINQKNSLFKRLEERNKEKTIRDVFEIFIIPCNGFKELEHNILKFMQDFDALFIYL